MYYAVQNMYLKNRRRFYVNVKADVFTSINMKAEHSIFTKAIETRVKS